MVCAVRDFIACRARLLTDNNRRDRWGGSRIIRYTPDGAVDLEVHFPTVLNVTACCFGGPNDDQLYVTTAHCSACGGDASRQTLYPDSGSLFIVDLAGQYRGGTWRHNFAG